MSERREEVKDVIYTGKEPFDKFDRRRTLSASRARDRSTSSFFLSKESRRGRLRAGAGGFVLAQGGAVELKFPGKNFFRSIPSNNGPYKHPGAVFADFAAQVGFL